VTVFISKVRSSEKHLIKVIDMSWESILKANGFRKLMMSELNELVGEEGDLEDIMKMIEKKFGVKSRIVSSSSSQPVLGFELPIYVSCRMGTKDNPSATSKFTVRDVGNKY